MTERPQVARPDWARIARRCAIVAGVFVLIVAAVEIHTAVSLRNFRIQDTPTLNRLRSELVDNPTDETLKQRIRQLDQAMRQRHFQTLQLLRGGAVLLTVGAVVLWVCLAGLLLASPARIDPPGPKTKPPAWTYQSGVALVTVGAVVLAAAGTLVVLLAFGQPDRRGELADGPAEGAALDIRWPRFRGPGGRGEWTGTVPLPGQGGKVLWSTPLTLPGKGSPVAWGDRLFLSAATATRRVVRCFAAADGRELWQRSLPALPGRDDSTLEIMDDTGYAAATPCTDGQRVYVIFANGDVAALDVNDGRIVWARPLGVPKNQYGLAASLLMVDGQLIVPFDQTLGWDDEAGREVSNSRLYALDPRTGRTLWSLKRPVSDSWTTPITYDAAQGLRIVTAANPWVIAYNAGGEEIWRVRCLSGDVAPSPAYAAGRLFVTNTGAGLFAIKPGGQGDVTDTHLLWSSTQFAYPDIISPTASATLVATLATWGTLDVYDAATGQRRFSHDLKANFYASPTRVGPDGDRWLLISEDGRCLLIAAEETYRLIAQADIGQKVYASPAFGAGRMFIRGQDTLLCIGGDDE